MTTRAIAENLPVVEDGAMGRLLAISLALPCPALTHDLI
jgi:hypothetical protein